MLALTLLVALTVAADPAPPSAEPTAPAQPAPAAAEAARIIEAPGAAAPEAPAAPSDAAAAVAPESPDATEPPDEPFLLDGFLPPERAVVGATVRLGGSGSGFEGAVEATTRWRGAVVGVSVGRAERSGEGVRTLGLVAGYGFSRGLYRGEALLGWGLASDRRDQVGATDIRSGHLRSVQLGLDRAVLGGDGWRATVGAGLWWRDTFGLAGSPTGHDEVGVGLRLGGEIGL